VKSKFFDRGLFFQRGIVSPSILLRLKDPSSGGVFHSKEEPVLHWRKGGRVRLGGKLSKKEGSGPTSASFCRGEGFFTVSGGGKRRMRGGGGWTAAGWGEEKISFLGKERLGGLEVLSGRRPFSERSRGGGPFFFQFLGQGRRGGEGGRSSFITKFP